MTKELAPIDATIAPQLPVYLRELRKLHPEITVAQVWERIPRIHDLPLVHHALAEAGFNPDDLVRHLTGLPETLRDGSM